MNRGIFYMFRAPRIAATRPDTVASGAVRNGRAVRSASALAVTGPMHTHFVSSGTVAYCRKNRSTPPALEKVR